MWASSPSSAPVRGQALLDVRSSHASGLAFAGLALLLVAVLQGLAVERGLGLAAPPGLVWMFVSGAVGTLVSLPGVMWAVRRAGALPRPRAALLHVLAAGSFSVAALGVALGIALALGAPPSKLPPLLELLTLELQNTLPLYAVLALGATGLAAWQRRQRCEREAAALREQLVTQELEAARGRLQPRRVDRALCAARSALLQGGAECDAHIQHLADALRAGWEDTPEPPREPGAASPPNTVAPLAMEPVPVEQPGLYTLVARFLLALPLIAAATLLLAQAMAWVVPARAELFYVGALGRTVGVWLALPVAFATSQLAQGRARAAQCVLHGAGFVAFASLWSGASSLAAQALCAAWGLRMPPELRFHTSMLLEVQRLTFVYAGVCAARVAWLAVRASHARERRCEELRSALAESRLKALDARVDPHFLFNALNTLSSLANTDPVRAGALIDALRELLGALASEAPDWSLRDEQRYTERFVEFVRARFGERVQVELALPAPLLDVRVPRLALQTLVENAVKHNQDRRRPLRVRVTARATPELIVLTVDDDGRGFGRLHARAPLGGGIDRLRRVLALLYGPRATVLTGPSTARGARVDITIPKRTQTGS